MPIDLQDRVSGFIDEVGRIERESETVYLELGRLFPRLSAEMERGADEARSSFAAFEAIGDLGRTGPRAGTSLEGRFFIEEASLYFGSLRERDSAFLAGINEGIARLGSLEEIISRVHADSEEMEIISLNAMTVALKSGAAGKAFSVITDELKRLSERTILLTEGVTDRGRSLLGYFSSLRNALAELGAFQRDFFAAIDRTLGEGYDEMERALGEARSFFSVLLGEARSVREPVLRVMGEVQLQDIVRQSLQHVGISLEEARDACDDDPGFVAAVSELTGSLIQEIAAKLDTSALSFGSDIGAVSSIVRESERKRREYLEAQTSVGTLADAGAFEKGSERYLELKREVMALSSRLTEHVAGLDQSFKGLAALLSRFQNIVVASRIEVAKTKALAGVSTTVGGMIELTARIEADVGAAMGTTKDFTRLAMSAIGGYSADSALGGGEDTEGERLVSTLRKVAQDVARLSRAQLSLRNAIEGFSLYTEDFISLIARAGDELSRLRALDEGLRSVGLNLQEFKSSLLAASVPSSTAAQAPAVDSERLRRMVERFTIFTHKKVAGSIGRFAVEEGGQAGEVTLF